MTKRLAACVAGLFALSASAAGAATTSCSTVAACIFGSNTSSGIGVEGSSKTGVGVTGTSTSGFGVSGISSSNHGVNGTSASSFGVVGITTENATSTGTARAGVLGEDSSTNKKAYNSGVAGTSTSGFGVSGTGGKYGGYFTGGFGVYAHAGIDAVADYSGYPEADGAVRAYGVNIPFQSEDDNLFSGVGCTLSPDTPQPSKSNCGSVATIDATGAAYFASGVTSAGSATYRTKTSVGQDVASYGPRETSPTIEDMGKAILVQGVAYVKLEATFSSAIRKTDYMVFLTPEGNSHGLYTSNLTSAGFLVKENDGGRSSLKFDYRIVAEPADIKAARLPTMAKRQLVAKRGTMLEVPKTDLR